MISDAGVGPGIGKRPPATNSSRDVSMENQMKTILKQPHNYGIFDEESDFNIYRSGSAPPTVEGSLTASGRLYRNGVSDLTLPGFSNAFNFNPSEEETRSHLDYLSSYHSHENHSAGLSQPHLTAEHCHAAQRFQTGSSLGGIGDRRKLDVAVDTIDKSLFSLQFGQKQDGDLIGPLRDNTYRKPSVEWLERDIDDLAGIGVMGLDVKTEGLAYNILQDGLQMPTAAPGHHVQPVNINCENISNQVCIGNYQFKQLPNDCATIEGMPYGRSNSCKPGLTRVRSLGSSSFHPFAAAPGASLRRSITPDTRMLGRPSSLSFPVVGGMSVVDKNSIIASDPQSGGSSARTDNETATSLSWLSLSKNKAADDQNPVQPQFRQEFTKQPKIPFYIDKAESLKLLPNGVLLCHNSAKNSVFIPDADLELPKLSVDAGNVSNNSVAPDNLPRVLPLGPQRLEEPYVHPQHTDPSLFFNGYNTNGLILDQRMISIMNNQLDTGGLASQNLNLNGCLAGSGCLDQVVDPLYAQCLQRNPGYRAVSASSPNNFLLNRSYSDLSQMETLGHLTACYETLPEKQKLQYEFPFLGKSGESNLGYPSRLGAALGMGRPYLGSSFLPTSCSRSCMRQNEQVAHLSSLMRNSTRGSFGSWHPENGRKEECYQFSLLEEFKNNKIRCFELPEIIGHVAEFSADQYGSRFIQQKLEIASEEEKNQIFPEIIPKARGLITDVFGNYVIQKFFEHGTECQRKELVNELSGYVLPLSLQMYGCRVIQKALEVVDVEQQTKMVMELDGSVMKCVRDQNGNHVIQKCIECVPQEKIQFIISAFYGQIVTLSTHPYGCRVIQRVLEYCSSPKTQHIMMEEILQSVCTLAQDQYGNYVVQHVLQHGKPDERSAIISMLSGQIVKMSQQKFSSNVVEKCLTYGDPNERKLLIKEILGPTDDNEPLQAMMKDQFANYVVQKVLETCDEQSRELILSRIKVHLNALKRYTYGKHIVARVEKLITNGEGRIGVSATCSS